MSEHPMLSRLLFIGGLAVLLGAFIFAGYSLTTTKEEAVEERDEIAQEAARSDYRLCIEIEQLKRIQREQAAEQYRNLGRNLRLLNIDPTPELLRISRENYEKTLKRFAPKECKELPSQDA